ncbi:hypothetical protein LTR34_010907 [Exophiala xenobiotica]|uniref:Uncharacterized protein n=1 Tax=Vermiconidia calcicola TaxID=1690605 RepID=A0AAV9PTA3_9PEZI|nr:hypothetical protein LTR93_011499 [Exophiala xenobiotica]KAK5425624.1 hypothetical protein LTR34_010907 [Exophiala xenobiotica]KAK5432276.1 hypothetical protein LTR18_011217 [Exophiala xenobiotica]KAK5527667.1 hypothetical protein LTR25_010990 [Vermiconidia calcicola]KAK5531545.1 hypothetical protein LTR23_009961 [Chaetothyriales sp. CCFEE 6169]
MAPWSEAEGRGPVGSAPPDYETIGREHLRGGAAAPDLATVKDFLRFYRATSQPRLDPDRSTADSIIIVAEWFFAGFTRVKGTPTDEEERVKCTTFGAVAKEHEKLCYNDAGFLLAMALASKSLFSYQSLEGVQKQEIPEGDDELVLSFHDSALGRPILTDLLYTPFSGDWAKASIADQRVFGQSYVANRSSVDGQAAFRDEDSDHRHIEYFQSAEKFHEAGLPDRLPAHLRRKVLCEPELRESKAEVEAASRLGAAGTPLQGQAPLH